MIYGQVEAEAGTYTGEYPVSKASWWAAALLCPPVAILLWLAS